MRESNRVMVVHGGSVGMTLGRLMPWAAQGKCRDADPDLFHPEKGESVEPAKAICRRCPVQAECLQWAIDHEEKFGVWAGTSAVERRKMRREARRRAA